MIELNKPDDILIQRAAFLWNGQQTASSAPDRLRSLEVFVDDFTYMEQLINLREPLPYKAQHKPLRFLINPLKSIFVKLSRPFLGIFFEKQIRMNQLVYGMAHRIAALELRIRELESPQKAANIDSSTNN